MATKANNMASDKRTKAQLLKALRNANDLLSEQEKKLAACQDELQTAVRKNEEYQTLSREHAALQAAMESADDKSHQLEEQIKVLQQELEEAKEMIRLFEEESIKKDDSKELQAELEKEQAVRAQLEEQVPKLKKQVSRLQEKLREYEHDEISASNVKASKSTFRIELYPRQGEFQGRIVYLLTDEKKVFQGLDLNTIKEFISSHLPIVEETTPVKDVEVESPPPGITAMPDHDQVSEQIRIQTFPEGREKPGHAIDQERSFQVTLAIPGEVSLSSDEGEVWVDASIFAKSLQHQTRRLLCKVKEVFQNTESVTVNIPAYSLEPGVYRLEAALTFLSAVEKMPFTVTPQHGALIQVF